MGYKVFISKICYVFICPFHQDLLVTHSVLGTVRKGGTIKTPKFAPHLFSPSDRIVPVMPLNKDFYLVCYIFHHNYSFLV